MTGPISVEEQRELLAGYVLYDLSPDEAALVKQWIAADPAIAQEIERLQLALEMTYAPVPTQPPEHLRVSLLNAHSAYRPMEQGEPAPDIELLTSQPEGRSRRDRLAASLGAVAAVLIVGLSISNYRLWRSLQTAIAQQQTSEVRTVALKATEEAPVAGSVTVDLATADLEALLEADLPPLPEGQVYVLWTVLQPDAPFTTDEKDAILTHVFTGDGPRDVEESVTLPPVYRDSRWIKAIAITVEDAAAPQRHVSSPILIEML